jgi:hypothetical protein
MGCRSRFVKAIRLSIEMIGFLPEDNSCKAKVIFAV